MSITAMTTYSSPLPNFFHERLFKLELNSEKKPNKSKDYTCARFAMVLNVVMRLHRQPKYNLHPQSAQNYKHKSIL